MEHTCVGDERSTRLGGPVGKWALAQEGLSGPVAEVDGESDAVAAEAGEGEDIFVVGVMAEDRVHPFGDENGAAPAVSDADVF